MKLLKSVLVALALLVGINAQAQQVKIGHINSADLLKAMPDVKLADTALAKYKKELEDTYNFLVAEFQKNSDDLNTHKKDGSWTQSVVDIKTDDLSKLQGQIQDFQQESQDKFEAKKQELYTPILNKADDAVKSVAKENGYAYVLDTSAGAILYAWDSDDLMSLVKKKLNLQ